MVYCPHCGEKNSKNAKFCRKCGKTLPEIEEKTIKYREIREKVEPISRTPHKIEDHKLRGYEGFEWNVVIIAALIMIICFGVLRRILPSIAMWIGLALAFIYIISASKRKLSIPLLMIMTFISLAIIYAFFNM